MKTSNPQNSILSGSLVGMLCGTLVLATVFALILEQIGAPQVQISIWMVCFAIGVYVFSGLFAKTMHFQAFQAGEVNTAPPYGGMAIAAGVFSGSLFLVEPGVFLESGKVFIATFSGTLAALALMTVLFSAPLARTSHRSITSLVYPQNSNGLFLFLAALISIVCSICLLLAQLKLLSVLSGKFFGFNAQAAVLLVLIATTFSLVMGGYQSLKVNRVLSYVAIVIAFFAPLIWISYTTTGNPIPQLSFGYGALQPVLEIDREMIEAGFASSEDVFNPTREIANGGYLNLTLVTLSIAIGIAALPHLLQHFFAVEKGRQARSTGIWSFWLVLVILTAIPAAALFAKLNIYTSILGLQISELDTETPWFYSLSGAGTTQLLLLCGQLVGSSTEIAVACGKPTDAFIGIQDISLNPDYLMVGLGVLSELPPILTTLIILAGLFCILSTVDGLLLVSANTVTVDIYNRIFRPRSPDGIKLFMNRFFLIAIAGLILLVFPSIEASPETLFITAIVIGGATLFPMLVSRIWLPSMTDFEIGTGMLFSFMAAVFLLVMHFVGGDMTAGSGDEISLKLSTDGEPFSALVIGLFGFTVFVIAAFATRFFRKAIRSHKNRKTVDA